MLATCVKGHIPDRHRVFRRVNQVGSCQTLPILIVLLDLYDEEIAVRGRCYESLFIQPSGPRQRFV